MATRWLESRQEHGAGVLYLKGAWRLPDAVAIDAELRALQPAPDRRVVLDGSRLEEIDTAAGFLLVRRLAQLGCTRDTVSPRRFDPRHRRLLSLVRDRMTAPPAAAHSTHLGLLPHIGLATVRAGRLLARHTAFVGELALELLRLVRRPAAFRPREAASQFEAVCLDAIPIVALVNFLVGVVIAYVLGVQALRYGASLFVADGIALGVCRELAPVLTSVVVAGRSGAAFTAQIGTMKVEEEIDAIRTLGLSPLQVLVIPRLLALVLSLPLLVFVGDAAGIAGGVAVGTWQLDIAPQVFLDRVRGVLTVEQLAIGLLKAPVFAVVIALIACRMGMLVARDARSVGENTTSTVVQCIVAVIVLDAIMAVALQQMGL